MDNEVFRLIARLKVAAVRVGQPVDVVRFAADRSYARTAMQQFAAVADEDGSLLVLQLMDKLGMTAPVPAARPAPVAAVAEPAESSGKSEAESRYIGRLR